MTLKWGWVMVTESDAHQNYTYKFLINVRTNEREYDSPPGISIIASQPINVGKCVNVIKAFPFFLAGWRGDP